jgi:hypothetical protein
LITIPAGCFFHLDGRLLIPNKRFFHLKGLLLIQDE